MQIDEDDCSWEEIYRSCGVRSDIDTEASSLGEPGVCPTPLANPFYVSRPKLERWMEANGIPEDAYV